MAASFSYKGIKDNKYTDGVITALNKDEAAYKLKEDKVIITSLEKLSGKEEKKDKKKTTTKKQRISKKIPRKEIIVFTKKFENMVRAGLDLLPSIDMIAKQTEHKGLKLILENILTSIESGSRLADAFAEFPQAFDNVYINLLRAGEASGKVPLFLQKLVSNMEKDQKIKANIKSALNYPIILLIVALAVVVLMMIYVVPVFQEMFANLEGGLPATTQMVVDLSEFVRDPLRGGMFAAFLIGFGFMLSISIKRNYKLRRTWHRIVLKLPIFGDLVRKSSLAKIAMIQSNLTAAGVNVMEALDIAANSNSNLVIQEALTEVKRGVFSGEQLSQLFAKTPSLFENSFVAMISVGEKTGNMEEMLKSIADYYEEEMDTTISRLTSMLEPIMIVFMGITVGFILVAMYTPMFSMGEAL